MPCDFPRLEKFSRSRADSIDFGTTAADRRRAASSQLLSESAKASGHKTRSGNSDVGPKPKQPKTTSFSCSLFQGSWQGEELCSFALTSVRVLGVLRTDRGRTPSLAASARTPRRGALTAWVARSDKGISTSSVSSGQTEAGLHKRWGLDAAMEL